MNDGDIEFPGADGDAGADEELPAPNRHRRWLPWAVAALLVAAGAAAVLRGASDHAPPSAAPSRTPTSSAAPFTADRAAVPTRQPIRHQERFGFPSLLVPRECPQAGDGLKACVTSHALPAPFYTAVRAQFPTVKPVAVTTEIVRPAGAEVVRALWSRQFTGEVGTTTLHIVVSAGVDPESLHQLTTTFDDGIRVRTGTWHASGSLAVQVFTSSPSGREPSSARLERLAGDPRLLRIG